MQTIQLPNVRLAVEIQGTGTPLLLVHGFPFDHSMWQSQIDWLSQVCNVVAPDLRGFGSSEISKDRDALTMDRFADDLAAMLDELVIEQVIYCGLSMGGYIGWAFARKHPHRLKGFIACDTLAEADTPEAASVREANAKRVLEEGSEFLVSGMIPKLFSEKTRKTKADIVEQVEAMIRNTASTTIAAALRGMAQRPDSTELLAEFEIPALVICGSDDIISPPEKMQGIADAIPHARFVRIPDAGHLSPLEQPDSFNREVAEWLKSI